LSSAAQIHRDQDRCGLKTRWRKREKRRCDIAGEDARRLETENGADPLSFRAKTRRIAVWMEAGGAVSADRKVQSGIDGQAFLRRMGEVSVLQGMAGRGCTWRRHDSASRLGSNARRQACHRLASGGFPLAPLPLPVVSGTRGKGRALFETASWRRAKESGGISRRGRFLQAGKATRSKSGFFCGSGFLASR